MNVKILIVLDIKGVNTESLRCLRKKLYEDNIDMKIAKNTLIKKALSNTQFEEIKKDISNQVAIAFKNSEELSIFKILCNFHTENPLVMTRCGMINGKFIDNDYIKDLAKIPNVAFLKNKILSLVLNNAYKIIYIVKYYILTLLNLINHIRRKK
jgi:large subunit ribosomal protein L10